MLIWFFLMGLLWNPYATIAIVIVVVILALTGYLLFKKKYIPRGVVLWDCLIEKIELEDLWMRYVAMSLHI